MNAIKILRPQISPEAKLEAILQKQKLVGTYKDITSLKGKLVKLSTDGFISYQQFTSFTTNPGDFASSPFQQFLTPSLFLQLPKDDQGRVAIDLILTFAKKCQTIFRVSAEISEYDAGRGFISEDVPAYY